MWRMRVRHASTLESYLQEVAALSIVSSLSAESRRRITAACALYQPALGALSSRSCFWSGGALASPAVVAASLQVEGGRLLLLFCSTSAVPAYLAFESCCCQTRLCASDSSTCLGSGC